MSMLCGRTQFDGATALLRTSQHVYAVAHPIFLSNYLFKCVPLRPRAFDYDDEIQVNVDAEKTDLRRMIWSGTYAMYSNQELDPQWVAGLKTCFEQLFDVRSGGGENMYLDFFHPNFFNNWLDNLQNYQDLELRAQRFAKSFLGANILVSHMRNMGRQNVAKVKHLCIEVGEFEWVDERTVNVAPYAIRIMSVLCGPWMPGLKR
jgi:hypothetical protein